MVESKYFIIEELVPQIVIDTLGRDYAWWTLDPRLVLSINEYRQFIGRSCTINNYKWGGNRQFSGLRFEDFYTDGKKHFSQHFYGRAGDLIVEDLDAQSAREAVKDMKKLGKLQYITTIEENVDWLHMDCRLMPKLKSNELFLVYP